MGNMTVSYYSLNNNGLCQCDIFILNNLCIWHIIAKPCAIFFLSAILSLEHDTRRNIFTAHYTMRIPHWKLQTAHYSLHTVQLYYQTDFTSPQIPLLYFVFPPKYAYLKTKCSLCEGGAGAQSNTGNFIGQLISLHKCQDCVQGSAVLYFKV